MIDLALPESLVALRYLLTPRGIMFTLRILTLGLSALTLAASGTSAQEHQHGSPSERLGTVHFATSCSPAVQKPFDRAVALLHSFQFREAIDGFNATLKIDSNCNIAYWGIALSQWSNPFAAGLKAPSQLEDGRKAAESGLATKSKTERESLYLHAVSK